MTDGPATRLAAAWAALAAAFAFLVAFHAIELFGTRTEGQRGLRRYELFELAFDSGRSNVLRPALASLSHFDRLGQRTAPLAAAGAMLVVALLIGDAFAGWTLGNQSPSGAMRWCIAFGLGAGLESLVVQSLGLAGLLSRTSLAAVAAAAFVLWLAAVRRVDRTTDESPRIDSLSLLLRATVLVAVAPFLLLGLLASLLQTSDFDALAYHLQGPKEWFQTGRIHFLEHNVYTTFPFLTEMFHLAGMTILGDWMEGALAGQAFLWLFAPFGGLAVGLLATRLFGLRSGWLAALIYLTTPWIYRLSSIPYVEGAQLFYGTIAAVALVEALQHRRWVFVVGCLLGCAGACKYTAVVMLSVPLSLLCLALVKPRAPVLASLVAGGALFLGPWLVRNVAWTGNPVYPLTYGVFGGKNWSPEKAAKFAKGHRSHDFSVAAFTRYLVEIPATSDWQSGLAFGLLPLALMRRERRSLTVLAGGVVYIFLAFWLFTHRLDRFWLPLEPFVVVASGAGLAVLSGRAAIAGAGAMTTAVIAYNLVYCVSGACGPNDYLADTAPYRLTVRRGASAAVELVEARTPPDSRTLVVGFGGVFLAEHPVLYHTVFDDCLFERLATGNDGRLKELQALNRSFADAGVDFVVFDWNWIRRYKQPDNYGYSAVVSEANVDEMRRIGFLRPVVQLKNGEERSLELYSVAGGSAK